MKSPISIENLQASILEIRGNKVLIDSDVAKIYGVETKRVNEAVKKVLHGISWVEGKRSSLPQ
jgi:hypothetical protein